MSLFYYRAVGRDGRSVDGTLEASGAEIAARQLRRRGLTLLELRPERAGGAAGRSRGRAPRRQDVLAMTGELAVLLRAGLPLDRALRVLIEMSSLPSMTALLEDLLKSVKDGKALSVALEPYESLFGRFYLNMLRSGEASGDMAAVLARLVEYLEDAQANRNAVISALIYPAILLVVALASIVLMLGFVVPQFESLFDDMGEALPTLTRAVLGMAHVVQTYYPLLLLFAVTLFYLLRRWLRSEAGQRAWQARALRLPVLGTLMFEYEMGRFARTLGTLLGSGVPLLRAVAIAEDTVGSLPLREALSTLGPSIKNGQRMSTALAQTAMFTPMVIQMTRVGEESGAMDQMMLELARVFDEHVRSGIKRALTLLEPLLILSMGLIISVIIVGILMGIVSVNNLAI